jgi:hypothetical protein
MDWCKTDLTQGRSEGVALLKAVVDVAGVAAAAGAHEIVSGVTECLRRADTGVHERWLGTLKDGWTPPIDAALRPFPPVPLSSDACPA